MSDFGLTPKGFVSRSQSELRADARARLQALFGGTTVDLSDTSVFTQILDTSTNALADLWALAQGLYVGAYPGGATGVQVDQLLAVNNMTRLPAKASVTDPTTAYDAGGNPLFGLVAYGTAGAVVPAGTLVSNGSATPAQFAVDAAITIRPAQNAQQALYFSNTPTSGTYVITLVTPSGESVSTPALPFDAQANATTLSFVGSTVQAVGGFWQLSVDGGPSVAIPSGGDASAVQGAIRQAAGYSDVLVSGDRSAGMVVTWPSKAGILAYQGSSGPTASSDAIGSIVQSLKAADKSLPFADVAVTGATQSLTFSFGAVALASGQPNTAAKPIALLSAGQSTLARSSSVTVLSTAHLAYGAPAQGVGSATCTAAGATQALAGQLTTLVNPLAGVTGVTNQLDVIAGRDVESDTDALSRLSSGQSSASTGSLAAILARTKAVTGVTQAVAFQNTTNASAQHIAFASAPTTGGYTLLLAGQATGMLAHDASAADVQVALRRLAGLPDVTVAPSGGNGFDVSFGSVSGAQAHDLAQVPTNTTGVAISVTTGCPAHAIEVVAEGGTATDIGAAILAALPAGIATYGRPTAQTTGAVTGGSASATLTSAANVATGQIVTAAEVPDAATVSALNGTIATLSKPALATNAASSLSFGYGASLTDDAGNPVTVRFSRPTPVPIYVELTLVTQQAGANAFSIASVAGIQQTIVDTINAVPIGSPVIVTGTNGLLNSFRSVQGITRASIKLGRAPSPTGSDNVAMAANETPLAESGNISIEVT